VTVSEGAGDLDNIELSQNLDSPPREKENADLKYGPS